MQIPLLSGRVFTELDTATSEAVAEISQQMAHQYWPNESPLGAQVRWARSPDVKWITVVGVVGDIRHDGLDDEAYPAVYMPLTQKQMAWKRYSSVVIRTRAGDPMSSADAVQHAVWKVDPQPPITFLEPMEAVMSESVAERRFDMVLLSLFAGLALVLAVVGLYGITSYPGYATHAGDWRSWPSARNHIQCCACSSRRDSRLGPPELSGFSAWRKGCCSRWVAATRLPSPRQLRC